MPRWDHYEVVRRFAGILRDVATTNSVVLIGLMFQKPRLEYGRPCRGYPDGQPRMYSTMFQIAEDPEDGRRRACIIKLRGYGRRNALQFVEEVRKNMMLYVSGRISGWKRSDGRFHNIVTVDSWMALPDWIDIEYDVLGKVLDGIEEAEINNRIIGQIHARREQLVAWAREDMGEIKEDELEGYLDGTTEYQDKFDQSSAAGRSASEDAEHPSYESVQADRRRWDVVDNVFDGERAEERDVQE